MHGTNNVKTCNMSANGFHLA